MANNSEEGQVSQRAVVPMMMMMLKADNLHAFCDPTIYKVWQLRRLKYLRASTDCCRDTFTGYLHISYLITFLVSTLRGITNGNMSDELEAARSVHSLIEAQSQHLPVGMRNTTRYLRIDGRCSGRTAVP
jgi:hypothetical protein